MEVKFRVPSTQTSTNSNDSHKKKSHVELVRSKIIILVSEGSYYKVTLKSIFDRTARISIEPQLVCKLSMQTTKDCKLNSACQQQDEKMASQMKSQTPQEQVDTGTEKHKPEHRIVEFIWEGDVDDSIQLMLPRTITVEECKNSLAEGLGIPYRNIKLTKNGQKLTPKDEIRPDPDAKIVVEFTLDDFEYETEKGPIGELIAEETSDLEGPEVTVQKVTMREPDGHKKYIEVGITREEGPREYFGGYRNKRTGQEYYHVKVQTLFRGCAEHNLNLTQPSATTRNRETQTLLPHIDQGVNTLADKCVQMSGTGVYIPAITDKIMSARPYKEYYETHKKMCPTEAVIVLQRAWRHYINMKRVYQKYKSIFDERVAKEQYKGSSLVEFHKQQLALMSKDSFPTSRSDFYDLYTVLGEWMRGEKKELVKRKTGFAHKVGMASLQKKQTEGLLAIEGHRIQAKNENLKKQDIMLLEGAARERVRIYPKGNRTFITDFNIRRAREIKEMYTSYTRTDVTNAERIEILTSIKNCLAGFETVDLTADLMEILQREIDLITMGINKQNMEYLKRRFESLYVDLAKNPEFNPQAKYYRKSSAAEKKYAMYRCINCHKVFPPSHMFMHLRMSRFRVCTSCSYMNSTATASINLAPYKRLLTTLRTAEMEKCCRSAVPFLLQPMGMYFLVNVLWDGRSIISGSSYLPGLKVTRWMPNEEWSMWNMILLTELEAYKHEKLANPLDFYSKEFVLNVMNRNILGRIHFRMVADIDEKFRKREPVGVLPKDHLLYTTKKAASMLPISNPHPCLAPSSATFGGHRRPEKQDVGT